MPKARDWRTAWRLCSLDRNGGDLISQQELPSEAVPGGLLVDRDGRVIVVMQDGTLSCFGGTKALAASVEDIMGIARQGATGKARAVQYLRHTLKTTQTPAARNLVQGSLEKLGVHVGDQAAANGGVAQWHLLGEVPWDMDDNDLDKAFVGEPNIDITESCRVGTRTLRWREYVTDEPYGMVNLLEIFGPRENIAAYGYAEVRLPEARDLLLKIGSNDGFKCWFNGTEVARFDGGRSYGPDQDSVPVKAQPGVNKILIKVSQHGGAWAFSVRLTDPSDKPLDLRQSYR
jgi:hypothetical protein